MGKYYEARERIRIRDLRRLHPEYFPATSNIGIYDVGANMTPADEWANVCKRRKNKDPLMRGGRSTEYRFMIGFPYAEDGTKLRKPSERERLWSMGGRNAGNSNRSLAHQGIDTKVPKDNDMTEAERIKNRERMRKLRLERKLIQFTKPVVVEYKGV